jgi:hypothetical protein
MIFIPRTSLQSVGFCVCTPPRHTTENPDFGGNSPVSLSCEIFMTEEEIRQLKHLLASAVEAACAEPGLLLKSDGTPREGNEQTIVFRVGIHLHELLKRTQYTLFNLDCEYNKHDDNPKEKNDGSKMRPDLLIHSRGNDDHNILVVEFAGWWKEFKDLESDKTKLEELTCSNGAYKYQLGVLVKTSDVGIAEYEYFRDGKVENI